MTVTSLSNFAARLVQRLGVSSCLIDAATGETIGPPDLPRLVSSFGAGLISAGLRKGDRILIGCLLSPPSGIAYLGAMYAGLVPVPVEEGALVSSGEFWAQGCGARAVWTERCFRFHWARDPQLLILHGHPAEQPTSMNPAAACSENDLAALVATSGSTGVPRFVMISHGNLTANTEAIIRSQHLANDDRAMLILPLSYCFGASVFHTHLYQGGGVVFDRRFMFPDKVLRAIDRYGCTTFAGVPTVYNILLRRSNIRSIPMPTVRRFLQAGGALAPQRIREMRAVVPTADFYVMYGQTEATSRISCLDPERLEDKLGSVGQPLDNLTVRIVDEDGRGLPSGEAGEILVKGPSISRGYLNDPEESRRVFRDGWLCTGDLAHQDEDGYIWIRGRKSAFLKIRGVRVSCAEVEATVAAVPGVYECAATVAPHEEACEALVLWDVPEQGGQNIAERVRRSLPVHWTCESIEIVAELPKTSNGKVSRSSLRAS
ncbi:MAG TPA: class I adenylate-forming enzyme family protein [Thermoleophilia bacterium]|nr:class I adenylate-forming enzyme family protein [Thermoleophilia bacterium]